MIFYGYFCELAFRSVDQVRQRRRASDSDPREPRGRRHLEGALQRAIDMAFVALSKPECAGLFGLTTNSANPSYLLQQLEKGTSGYGYFAIDDLPKEPGTVTSAKAEAIWSAVDIGNGATQLKPTGASITINDLEGSFVSGTPVDQAVTVLHELGHAFTFLWGVDASAIRPDGNSVPNHVQVSEANTALVKEKCFK